MHDHELLTAAIRELAGDAPLIVVHSSLPHLRAPGKRPHWQLAGVFRELAASGTTVAVPTFTFSFCRGATFDLMQSVSEVGILGEAVRALVEARRTPHPIYSHAVVGPLADAMCQCRNTTTFGDDSVFAFFEEHDARMIMLGCGWEYCTAIHRREEVHRVPYRYYKDFVGDTVDRGQRCRTTARMFVRDLDVGAVNDFSPVGAALGTDQIRQCQVWEGRALSASIRDIVAIADRMLTADPWALVSNRAEATARHRAAASPAFRIALLGSSNLDTLSNEVTARARELMPEQRVELCTARFGQMFREVFDADSPVRAFRAGLSVFVDRLEDLCGVASIESVDAGRISAVLSEYIGALQRYRDVVGGTMLVHRFASLATPVRHLADEQAHDGVAAIQRDADDRLRRAVAGLPDTVLLAPAELAARSGVKPTDLRDWLIGRYPFSHDMCRVLATEYVRAALSATGRGIRAIVVDLDNTLWGGVLGEDGIDSLELAGDYPGNAFRHFQSTLRQLNRQGVLLAAASKNDHDQAVHAIRNLSGMQLQLTDFAALRINWREKWQNLAEISEELGIGLRHILFVDDSPVERLKIRQFLPEVHVLDLPDSPADRVDALLAFPRIAFHQIGAEDKARARGYQQRAALHEARRSAPDFSAFVAGLSLEIHIEPLHTGNAARAVQLLSKTNQFNLTTRRHDRAALKAIEASGGSVFVIAVKDRFTDLENNGVLIVRPRTTPADLEIDSYLLSCRILGKGVERAVLAWLAGYARRKGFTRLIGTIIETERNQPAQRVLGDCGFVPSGAGEWALDTAATSLTLPDGVRVVEQLDAPARHD
ncbi:MAG: HAD-IIIC family phosphatase [Planctomycetota bacterium]